MKGRRQLDFSLLPSIEGMSIFVRLDEDVEDVLSKSNILTETYERASSALMFFCQTQDKDNNWRNDARLRAGLNEFYSLESADVRDLRAGGINRSPPKIRDSSSPLVHLMYILRHVGVHSKPVKSELQEVNIISTLGGGERDYSYGAVMLNSLTVEDLKRCNEAITYYEEEDLARAVDWLTSKQRVFGVNEVLRKGISAYCREILQA